MKHPFRSKNLSPRLFPVYALAALTLVLARPTATALALGGALIAAGAALRVWGAGHLVKNDRLTVSGPYAHLQHPLYAGTLMLGSGFAVVAGGPVLLLVVGLLAPAFFLYYLPYKDRIESARLERTYGQAYVAYRAEVPRLIPALVPWRPPAALAPECRRRWSARRFWENSEAGTLLAIAVAFCWIALRPLLAA